MYEIIRSQQNIQCSWRAVFQFHECHQTAGVLENKRQQKVVVLVKCATLLHTECSTKTERKLKSLRPDIILDYSAGYRQFKSQVANIFTGC